MRGGSGGGAASPGPSRYARAVKQTPNSVRRAFRAASAAGAVGLLVTLPLLASPAGAVPEGWSDPDEVDPLYAIVVLGGIPLALFVLIAFLVYVPSLVRGGRQLSTGADDEWFGGPRKSREELADPDGEGSKAGGASARW